VASLRKSALACFTSCAIISTYGLAVASPAGATAPNPETVAVTGLLSRLSTDFLPKVATSTAVSQQLPTVAITPAESVGLKTAFSGLLGPGGLLEDLSAQTTLGDVASYVAGADGEGWTLDATASGNSLTLGFTRKVSTDVGLDIRDPEGTLSLSTGDGIDVTGTLTGSFTLAYDPTSTQAFLTSPSMSIRTTAGLPAGKVLKAGLGILGVSVTGTAGDADYALSSAVSTAWANPDSDALGRLGFDDPARAGADDGELAADGAATGIVTATRTGSLQAHLVAAPRSTGAVAGLPSVGATVDVSSTVAGSTFEAPSVVSTVDAAAKPFLTMTPRDLAAGLSQAASAVLGMQNAQDGKLPLMRGSIANAVDAVGGIKEFLADQVPDADPDDTTPGQPRFASLQDMLSALDTASYGSGWSIDVLTTGADAAAYDAVAKKVSFTVRTTRSATKIELDVLGGATAGTGTSYSGLVVTASGVDFNGPHDDMGAELAGRRITAGGSYATVASVTGDSALTVTAAGWVNGTPADGTYFSVEAADPKTGAPELADALTALTGISNANAEVSTAEVSPDVTVTLPMALDLRAPLTYASDSSKLDCNPDPAVESPCPFKQVDTSGLGRVITSLPLAADRVLLRQSVRPVLVADAHITSPIQIKATSGFLGLSLSGDVDVDAPGGHLQTLALTKSGDVPVPAFVEQVRQQSLGNADPAADVFAQTLGGSVTATVDVQVDDAPDAFAPGEDSTTLTVTGDVADLADGIDSGDLTVTPDDPDSAHLLAALNFEPNNPTSLFGGISAAFKSAGSDLTTMTGGGLDVPIPFVGSSVGQLIGAGASGGEGTTYTQNAGTAAVPATGATPAVPAVPATTTLTDARGSFGSAFLGRQIVVGSTTATIVNASATSLTLAPQLGAEPDDGTPYLVENELLGAVHVLQAMTPATLQEALGMAQSSLGHDSTIDFGLVKDGAVSELRLDLTWERAYKVAQPVSLEFGQQQLVGASAGGELQLDASGTVKLRLFLPLSASAMLTPITSTKVDAAESSVDFHATVAATGAHVGATVGPLSVALGTAGDPGSFKAGFGVLAGSKATGTPSLGTFFSSGFDLGITNGGACAGDSVLCADFPVYVNGSLVPTDNLTVTSKLGSSSHSLAGIFTGASTAVHLPTGLQALVDGQPFRFDSLSEGLQQYLFYTETALRTASNNGEMPVVGKDLQAGADFLGDTRARIATFLKDNGDVSQVGPAKTLLTDTLSKALGTSLNGPTGIQLGFTCTVVLEAPTTVAAEVKGTLVAADTTQYLYKVVPTYKKSATDTLHESKPSAATTVVTNASPLTTSKFNKVTWSKSVGATGYEVIRATQTTPAGGGAATVSAYALVGTVSSGTTLTLNDQGAPSAAYAPVTSNYPLPATECPDDAQVTKVEGVTLGMKLGQGGVSATQGCKDEDPKTGRGACLGGKLPLDLGIPGLSLKTGDSGSVSGAVGWALDLKVGMSRSKGFYVDTADKDELEVGAALKLDLAGGGPDLKAQLAIINVDVTKKDRTATAVPEFVGHFGIDLVAPGNTLTLASMKGKRLADAIVVSVEAKVDLNWHLAASVDSALPGVSTDFRLTWGWGASTSKTPSNPVGLKVRFDHVILDAGDFFGKALKPYLQQIIDATKPLQPVLDTIFTPMPVISDLSKAAGGDEVTIATLAATFSTIAGGPKIKPFLDAIKTVKDFLANVKCGAATCGVDIGSFELSRTRVATTSVSAGNATNMIDKTTPGAYQPNDKATTAAAIADKDTSGRMSNASKRLLAGLSFPVIDDPTILFDLISGGDIPLVEFDSGPLTLGFQFQKSFGPIYAPPPVMMVIGGGASVSMRIAAGFDTYGIRRAIETGEGAQILDSLYFKTVDKAGNPIPVVQFTGYLEAGASVSLGVLEVGVVGGIKLTVGFYWNDPNNDGKFRLFEFGAAVANNPICLFNVGGELSLYIKVFVTIGFSPFAVSFDFTLINIKLLDFNLAPNCTPPPPRLGGTSGGVLYVFAGALGHELERGNKAWDNNGDKNETFVVRQVPKYTEEDGTKHDPAVEIRGLGITESFDDPGGTTITTVVLDGRDYKGNITVTFTGGSAPTATSKPDPFTKRAVVFGGKGDDIIRTGEGESWVDGGPGDDNIVTLDRQDLTKDPASVHAHVAGGPGKDVVTVGNGDDTVAGDASLRPVAAAPTVDLAPIKTGTVALPSTLSGNGLQDAADADLFSPSIPDAGDDQIAAGLGTVTLSGNGGVDTIGSANDSPLADSAAIKGTASEPLFRGHSSVLVGGGGGDVLKSGSADDKVYTGSKTDIGESGTGSGDLDTDVNTVDTGTGSDTVYGSNGIDFVTTHSTTAQKAVVYGGGADDVLTGGQGSDEIYGGPGDDYVVASPATVGAPGSATDVLGSARAVGVLPGASTSTKKLVGGTGSDRIYGSDGPSTIFGDTTVDACDAQSDPVSRQPKETTVAGDAEDLILGGNGVDVINAGGGDDWTYASGAGDRVCGNAGADHLYAGDGNDLVYGGTGADQAYGEAGDDQVYGNDDDDSLYGSAGQDRVQGGKGSDWLDGGSEGDVLLGGTSKAGTADVGDTLFGAGGPDVLIGDDAQTDVAASAPYPTDLGSSDGSLGGKDFLVGGDDADRIYGGLDDDTTYGGGGDDYAEGGPGTDHTWGQAGDDDLIGGSSELASGSFAGSEPGRPDAQDTLSGGDGQDVLAGDNASITRGGTAHPVMAGHELTTVRGVDLADEDASDASGLFGADTLDGDGAADIVFGQRGDDTVNLGDGADYGEGGRGVDDVTGGNGDDDVVGGSYTPAAVPAPAGQGQPDSGDTLSGDAGEDVVLGDNGALTRAGSLSPLTANRVSVQRSLAPYDLGESPAALRSGADTITGGTQNDVLLGQGGDDSVDAGDQDDYAEGGQGSDLVVGGAGDDDALGGSSASTTSNAAGAIGQPDGSDDVYGGEGSDLVVGDDALLTRVTSGRDWRTNRANAAQSALVPGRGIALYDLNGPVPAAPTAGHSAADALSGQGGADVLLGQDGNDTISGGGDDDYVEGQGGSDAVHGDVALSATEIVTAAAGAAWSTPLPDAAIVLAGQDDLTGGWSKQGYRDGIDVIRGDGDDDFEVGDNGSIARVLIGSTETVYSARYGGARTGHAKVRVAGGGASSTRFCPTTGSLATSTCEVAGAWGADDLSGDAGQDVVYGQDGNDTVHGGDGDDDLYGELGNDTLFGEDGEDAILGDRGGVQDRYESGARSRSTTLQMPPAVTYKSRRTDTVSREADLLHDVNGSDFVGGATSTKMPLNGIAFGGADRIRGGNGNDAIHAGAGDDLVNGDTGGDTLFGDGGKDVMWGGMGRLCAATDAACQADPGATGQFVDHLAGGKDADVLDWRPRGAYGTGVALTGRTCSTSPDPVTTQKDGTTDPCSWFEMTDMTDATAANNQHHQGIDWIYGGWDRDVMQGDQTANGPNPGDRLIDWAGVYNLYSHCNAAYGGFNDVRNFAPAVQGFLQEWAAGQGAGRPGTSPATADAVTSGTSAYEELALVYNQGDLQAHGTGSAYPTTPGHFDAANACGVY
jgi:Ca2+-binding RTX toxin-like protein